MSVPEVRALLGHLLDKRLWDEDKIIAWSRWRQERNRVAKACHCKRRQATLTAIDLTRQSRSKREAL
jgi:hypothetical protein